MSNQKPGAFDDIVEMTPEPLRPVTLRLRSLILAVDPEACIIVRTGHRAATFGLGPAIMREGYCYIMPHANWVNLGFSRGADIPDPGDRLEGQGVKMRRIKVRALEDCEDPHIVDLIREARDECWFALGRA